MDQSTIHNIFHGPLKIAVVGAGESGKSTLCRMLAEHTARVTKSLTVRGDYSHGCYSTAEAAQAAKESE